MLKTISVFCSLIFLGLVSYAQENIPEWKEGDLDILVFKTGRGDAIFTIMPDGTTMLTDPGELDLTDPRTWSPRNSSAYPNASRFADEWIASYIKQVNPNKDKGYVDYAFITHFHDDHYGMVFEGARKSKNGKYLLSGITGLGENIKFGKLVDRGYPEYKFPKDIREDLSQNNKKEYATFLNYLSFLETKKAEGMKLEGFEVGRQNQFKLMNAAGKYPKFSIFNTHANGLYWDPKTKTVQNGYPTDGSFNPSENGVSCGILIEYNGFKFFHGGDTPGVPNVGSNSAYDLESKIAPIIGEVDVAMANHHAGRDVLNPIFISTLKPRVWFQVVWSSDQPSHETLNRMLSQNLYKGPRDLFATDILESNKTVIGDLLDKSYQSNNAHIWLQVSPNGSYKVHTLETVDGKLSLIKTFEGYHAKVKK